MIFTSDVVDQFSNLLREVLAEGRTSEDRVRYSLFTALREKSGINDSEIRLEYPHPKIKGAKLDSFLQASEKHKACAWELKYDHRTPGGKNQPRSNKAGALINDFFRLAAMSATDGIEKIVIYLTDAEMASYFRNPKNGFSGLFDLAAEAQFRVDGDLLASRAQSVRNKVKAPIIPCYAIGKFAVTLPRDHQLRIYEVRLS